MGLENLTTAKLKKELADIESDLNVMAALKESDLEDCYQLRKVLTNCYKELQQELAERKGDK